MIPDDEIRAIYEKGPDAVIALIRDLFKGFELQIAVLEARIRQFLPAAGGGKPGEYQQQEQRQTPFQRWTGKT